MGEAQNLGFIVRMCALYPISDYIANTGQLIQKNGSERNMPDLP